MRKSPFFVTVFAFLALLMPPALAEDFDFSGVIDNFDAYQHDFALTNGSMVASARTYSGSDVDYWHAQLDFNLSDDLTIGARYADADLIKEYRVHAAYDLWEQGPFYVTPILSYHYFDGGELVDRLVQGGGLDFRPEDNLNYGRLGIRIGASQTFDSGWNVYAYHEPRFTFLGDTDGFEFSETKSEGGFSKNIGALRAGPFIQYTTDDDYDKIWLIAGTRVSGAF